MHLFRHNGIASQMQIYPGFHKSHESKTIYNNFDFPINMEQGRFFLVSSLQKYTIYKCGFVSY
jgi:hypothetical protein